MSKSKQVPVGAHDYDEPSSGLVNFRRASGVRSDMGSFEPSLARQEFADECDINTIMERYEKAGAFTHVNRANPIYMDCTAMPDLRGAMDIMREASIAFGSLPAKVRREFDNDPAKFVDYCQDTSDNPDKLKQLREWGLADPEPAPVAPTRVEVVNTPPVGGAPGGDPKPA